MMANAFTAENTDISSRTALIENVVGATGQVIFPKTAWKILGILKRNDKTIFTTQLMLKIIGIKTLSGISWESLIETRNFSGEILDKNESNVTIFILFLDYIILLYHVTLSCVWLHLPFLLSLYNSIISDSFVFSLIMLDSYRLILLWYWLIHLHIFVLLPNLCAFFCLSHLLIPISFVFATPWQSCLFLNSFNQPNMVILYCLRSPIKCSMFLSDSNLPFLPLFQYFSLPHIVQPEYSRVWRTLAGLT